jgi:hypothetical protein
MGDGSLPRAGRTDRHTRYTGCFRFNELCGLRPPALTEALQRGLVNESTKIRALHELIAALDRRRPRVERAGEASVARDAAALKAKAIERLAELEQAAATQPTR